MEIIAHRGACHEAVENSWSAFERAVEVGADRIETDVYLTQDDELVVMHEEYLTNIDGSHRHVFQVTRKILEELRLGNDEPIPFLDQLLERLLHRIEINIEIKPFALPSGINNVSSKEQYIKVAERVATLVKKFNFKDRVIVSSFELTPLSHIVKFHPEIKVAVLWLHQLKWPILSYLKPQQYMKECQTDLFYPYVKWVDKSMMKWTKTNGYRVYPFVDMEMEETQELWEHLYSMGIDGLFTNEPRKLRRWLKDRSK